MWPQASLRARRLLCVPGPLATPEQLPSRPGPGVEGAVNELSSAPGPPHFPGGSVRGQPAGVAHGGTSGGQSLQGDLGPSTLPSGPLGL